MNFSEYNEFLKRKAKLAVSRGFEVARTDIRPLVEPDEWKAHQLDLIQWAVAGGCRAIFAAFGLGKSLMQVEILRLIQARTRGPVLIVCPLGVRQEFFRDANKLGLSDHLRFIRTSGMMSPGCGR